MSTVSIPAEQRVVLNNVSWRTYVALLEDADSPRGRMAYDQGVLEIMAPSWIHETIKRLIGRMVEAFTEELGIEICSASSTTFKRDDLKRGIESDECYYVQRAAAVRDKEHIDLFVDPSPDLAIEVDISRTSMDKFGIRSALQINEVWRYDGESLRVFVLRDSGEYVATERSQVLPQFPIEEVTRFLEMRHTLGETELIRTFRAWVRENVLGSQ